MLLFLCTSTILFQSIVVLMSPKEQAVKSICGRRFLAAQKDIKLLQSPDFAAEATVVISASKFPLQCAGKSTIHASCSLHCELVQPAPGSTEEGEAL